MLANRRGICAGYAALLRDMILAQNIPAIYCSNLSLNSSSYASTASGDEDHFHTEAYVGGRWIVMDATWDSNNEYRCGSYLTEALNGFYYFDITPEVFVPDHKTAARDQKDYVIADDGFGYSADVKTIVSYSGHSSDVVTPNSVTAIADNVFLQNRTITDLTIGSSMKLGKNVFNDCEDLCRVVFESGVTSIPYDTFNNCWSVAAVEIPATVTFIVERAFVHCSGLEHVHFGGSESQWAAISIGARNDALTKVTIHYNSTMQQLEDPTQPENPEQTEKPMVKPEDLTQETGVTFRDVPAASWYADAVTWAVEQGITNGTSKTTFSSNATCTRAQIGTLLCRALDN